MPVSHVDMVTEKRSALGEENISPRFAPGLRLHAGHIRNIRLVILLIREVRHGGSFGQDQVLALDPVLARRIFLFQRIVVYADDLRGLVQQFADFRAVRFLHHDEGLLIHGIAQPNGLIHILRRLLRHFFFRGAPGEAGNR